MNEAVTNAIEGLRAAYPDAQISADPDNDGGAYVVMEPMLLGELYSHETSWILRVTLDRDHRNRGIVITETAAS